VAKIDIGAYEVQTLLVNSPPSFTMGADQDVTDESGPQSVVGWATSIVAGPPNEAWQTVQFVVEENTNPAIFAVQPAIDASGKLTFTPQPNASGSANITVVLKDNGGTGSGGIDTSAPQTFAIYVTKPHSWHNTLHMLDVGGSGGEPDGMVVAGDALAIINYINAYGAGAVPAGAGPGPYVDTNGDNFVAPNDVLAVIEYINAFGAGLPGPAGEGEAAAPTHANVPGQLDERLLDLLAMDTAWLQKRRR
jgi:hypothetical protein